MDSSRVIVSPMTTSRIIYPSCSERVLAPMTRSRVKFLDEDQTMTHSIIEPLCTSRVIYDGLSRSRLLEPTRSRVIYDSRVSRRALSPVVYRSRVIEPTVRRSRVLVEPLNRSRVISSSSISSLGSSGVREYYLTPSYYDYDTYDTYETLPISSSTYYPARVSYRSLPRVSGVRIYG